MSHSPKARLRARRFAAGLLAAAMTASCIPAAFAADNDTSKSWTFTWFGPSTSETANTVSAPDGIGGKIVMTSCTSKEDGTIDKKGRQVRLVRPRRRHQLLLHHHRPGQGKFLPAGRRHHRLRQPHPRRPGGLCPDDPGRHRQDRRERQL